MKTISLNGESFVKAADIARDLGYTADYVGQLCRSGKVEAQLVGRSWYVNETSIKSHKKSRYRSSATKTKTALKQSLQSKQSEPPIGTIQVEDLQARRKLTPVEYVTDDTELMPKMTGKSEVRFIASKPLPVERIDVKATGVKYRVTTTELPKIRLQGAVKIADAEAPILPKSKHLKLRKKDQSAASCDVAVTTKKTPPITRQKPQKKPPVSPATVQPTVSVPVESVETSRSYLVVVQLVTTICLAVIISLAVLGTERHTTVTVDNNSTSFHFNLAAAVESLKYIAK